VIVLYLCFPRQLIHFYRMVSNSGIRRNG
jgi:hypothetical protein